MSKALTSCGRLAYKCDLTLGITLDPKGNRCATPPALDELGEFVDAVDDFEREFTDTASLDDVPDSLKLVVGNLVAAAHDFSNAVYAGRFRDVMFEAGSLRVAVERFNEVIFERAKHA